MGTGKFCNTVTYIHIHTVRDKVFVYICVGIGDEFYITMLLRELMLM